MKDQQTAAEALYGDIDNLELHVSSVYLFASIVLTPLLYSLKVGMQAEEAKKPMPGAGLCPGYTISRAILADAVCLTRGDRFLTVDFTRSLAPTFIAEPLAKPMLFSSVQFHVMGLSRLSI